MNLFWNRNQPTNKAGTPTTKRNTTIEERAMKPNTKITFSTQYCSGGRRHYCFYIRDKGWFVMVAAPNSKKKAMAPDAHVQWYEVNSVIGVNSAERVKDYICECIVEGRNKIDLARKLYKIYAENPNLNHHDKNNIPCPLVPFENIIKNENENV